MISDFEIFKALSEEIRLRIVILLTVGELCVCDLMEVLNLPQSTVSRHMAKLKSSSLVSDRRQGKWIYYTLNISDKSFHDELIGLLNQIKLKEPYSSDIKKVTEYIKTKNC